MIRLDRSVTRRRRSERTECAIGARSRALFAGRRPISRAGSVGSARRRSPRRVRRPRPSIAIVRVPRVADVPTDLPAPRPVDGRRTPALLLSANVPRLARPPNVSTRRRRAVRRIEGRRRIARSQWSRATRVIAVAPSAIFVHRASLVGTPAARSCFVFDGGRFSEFSRPTFARRVREAEFGPLARGRRGARFVSRVTLERYSDTNVREQSRGVACLSTVSVDPAGPEGGQFGAEKCDPTLNIFTAVRGVSRCSVRVSRDIETRKC